MVRWNLSRREALLLAVLAPRGLTLTQILLVLVLLGRPSIDDEALGTCLTQLAHDLVVEECLPDQECFNTWLEVQAS